jgi:hypothetical protein
MKNNEVREEKFIIIFDGQKIYLNAKNHTTDRNTGVYRFFGYQNDFCIATFPIDLTGIILNNPSR